MGQLVESIRRAVREERYFFSDHAETCWENGPSPNGRFIEGLEQGRVRVERPYTRPNPTSEVERIRADGTPVNAVWAHVRMLDFAKLVTVHFFDK